MKDQILLLHADGKTPTEIAAELGVLRSYVYKVIGQMSDAKIQLSMLEEIRREIREMKSMLRLILGEPRHPVERVNLARQRGLPSGMDQSAYRPLKNN